MTRPCTARRYRTARYARRQAFSQEPDASRRPVPKQCEDPGCGGAWHLVPPEPR